MSNNGNGTETTTNGKTHTSHHFKPAKPAREGGPWGGPQWHPKVRSTKAEILQKGNLGHSTHLQLMVDTMIDAIKASDQSNPEGEARNFGFLQSALESGSDPKAFISSAHKNMNIDFAEAVERVMPCVEAVLNNATQGSDKQRILLRVYNDMRQLREEIAQCQSQRGYSFNR